MSYKKLSVILFLVAVVVAVALLLRQNFNTEGVTSPNDSVAVVDADTLHITHGAVYYDNQAPHADPMIVGKWHLTDKPLCYKAYYDDYDGNGYFWGKEWDESEDVMEDDLDYHGNGWFRWKKQGKELQEYAVMEIKSGTPIPKFYIVKYRADSTMILTDKNFPKIVRGYVRLK